MALSIRPSGKDYMGRNIVLCFDGTNNEYAAKNTNLVQLYAMLDHMRNDQLG